MAIADIMKRAKAAIAERSRSGNKCAKDADTRASPETAGVDDIKWYVIRSGVLNDRFVLCMRKSLYREVTERFPDTVIYFLPEMEELLSLQDGLTQGQWCNLVREVHLVKKTFRGWVVPKDSPYMRELRQEVRRTPQKGGQSNAKSQNETA